MMQVPVQRKSQTFDAGRPIIILSFLNDVKLTCDVNGVHTSAAMWLLHLLTRKPVSAFLSACHFLNPKL